MQIELLYFDGCPSHDAFVPRLIALLEEEGVRETIVQRRVVADPDAQREKFLGSPTLRINGIDVDPDARGRSDFGLKCRLYRTDDGLRGTPPDAMVITALRRARPAA